MASKQLDIDGLGPIKIVKRRGQKSIRISISGSKVSVSQPSWLPFSAGEAFIRSRRDWVKDNLSTASVVTDDYIVTNVLALRFIAVTDTRFKSKIIDGELCIYYPQVYGTSDTVVQDYARKKIARVRRSESEEKIPRRVSELAETCGFSYKSVQIKSLKRRWGSCNSLKELIFNQNLISLDPLHIDYVILHELTHTIHMNHSADFWNHLESVFPGAKK